VGGGGAAPGGQGAQGGAAREEGGVAGTADEAFAAGDTEGTDDEIAGAHGGDGGADLDDGADDYLSKPFDPAELASRIRAVLRRRSAEPDMPMDAVLTGGPVRMDIDRHVVTVNGEEVPMPLKEFELLEILLRNVGRVMTRGQLIERVWGADYVGDTKTLDVHIKRLRSKIEPDSSAPRYVVTVRGLGYKFEN